MKKWVLLLLFSHYLIAQEEEDCCYAEYFVTPTSRVCPCFVGLSLTGEYLYWQATSDTLVFANELSEINWETKTVNKTKTKRIEPKWHSGARLGIAYDFGLDEWRLSGIWTSMVCSSTTILTNKEPKFAIALEQFPHTDILQLARFAKGQWEWKFHGFDLELGRQYFLSDTFEVFPQFGLKTVWMKQRFFSHYKELFQDLPAVGLVQVGDANFKSQGDFWGIGPKLSLFGKWNWTNRFGPFGKAGGSLFWGEFRNRKAVLNRPFDLTDPPSIIVATQTSSTIRRVRPMVEVQVGVDWTACVCQWLVFQFQVAFEAQYFWKQSAFFEDEDVDLKGLVMSGSIGF